MKNKKQKTETKRLKFKKTTRGNLMDGSNGRVPMSVWIFIVNAGSWPMLMMILPIMLSATIAELSIFATGILS